MLTCDPPHSPDPSPPPAWLHSLLEESEQFDQQVRDNADFRDLVKRFPQQTDQLIRRLLNPTTFNRLVRNCYDFNFTLKSAPHFAADFFGHIEQHGLFSRLFYQYPQLRNTTMHWPEFRLRLFDMALRNQKHLRGLFIYPCHLTEALQRFPERRAALIHCLLGDLARTRQLIPEQDNYQRLLSVCRGLHPAFNAANVTAFHQWLQDQQRTRQEVGKNARLLACFKRRGPVRQQDHSRFTWLPEELLMKIAADTADLNLIDASEALALAEQHFERPPAP